MDKIAISVRNLTKRFQVYDHPKDLAIEVLTRRKRHRLFTALENVTFDIAAGEVVGIIGANGAGKSTLLKIITGVLAATEGELTVSGKVTAILELGLGFHPEYSGRENVFLSGLLYGMQRPELERKMDSIVEFSGLAEFIDQPVKTYSSGMSARLAFSIATAVDPEILIIDEALAAGDSMFVQKCFRRVRELCNGGATVILVSHGTGMLAQLCQKVIWMEKGKVRMVGQPLSVIQAYDLAAHQGVDGESWIESFNEDAWHADSPLTRSVEGGVDEMAHRSSDGNAKSDNLVFRRGPIFIRNVTMLDWDEKLSNTILLLQPFKIRIEYEVKGAIPKDGLGVAIAVSAAADLSPVMQWSTQNIRPGEIREEYNEASFRIQASQEGIVELLFQYAPFCAGDYILSLGLLPNVPGSWEFYEYRHFFYRFSVVDGGFGLWAPFIFEPQVSHLPLPEDRLDQLKGNSSK